jgi:two-component system, sensor histidine kinase and response regulator
LENNLATGVFTPGRVEIIGLLGTQAAISITNAQIIAARAEQGRLQLENEFLERQSQELARLNADKDKFFSIVSHDLRGPFSSLLTGSEMLLLRLDNLTLEEIRERTQYMHNSSRAAYNLLENLLTWSKLQMGRMVYDPGEIGLALLARNTVDLLRETAAAKEIALRHTIPQTVRVHVDRYMVETVIRNLVGNAIKFTPQGGEVIIAAEESDGLVTVSVSDTGIGMNEDEMAKLFRIDVHFTRPGTAKESGSGLGLTICKEMVEKNNGRIWAESVEGQGTTIKFTLPAASDVKHEA